VLLAGVPGAGEGLQNPAGFDLILKIKRYERQIEVLEKKRLSTMYQNQKGLVV
jgi:hypothetical protein